MIRFIGWRLALIAFVGVAIIYFVHLGMQMMGSAAGLPANADFFDHSRVAWQQTRTFCPIFLPNMPESDDLDTYVK